MAVKGGFLPNMVSAVVPFDSFLSSMDEVVFAGTTEEPSGNGYFPFSKTLSLHGWAHGSL